MAREKKLYHRKLTWFQIGLAATKTVLDITIKMEIEHFLAQRPFLALIQLRQ